MASILFLAQVLPYPLDAGPKVRAYYVLRHLAQSHRVTLVSFVRPEDAPEHIAHLRTFCEQVQPVPMHRSAWRTGRAAAIALSTGRPVIIERDRSPEMLALLRSLVEMQRYDYIHADQTSMVQYALTASEAALVHGSARPHLVLDAHNALFKVMERLAAQTRNPVLRLVFEREARHLRCYETESYRRFDDVVFVTEEDRDRIGLAHAYAIPICGDPNATPMAPRRDGKRITFAGALHWPPNAEGIRWFLNEVWPIVHRSLPDVTLTIIGKQPPHDLAEMNRPNVETLGYVADLQPFLAETCAWIVPLWSGGGMRVKIVDAWTWGVPVVSTRIGAEGLAYTDGENLLIADTPQDFAAAISRLVHNADLAESLRQAGRHTAIERYGWRSVYTAWDAIYPPNAGRAVTKAEQRSQPHTHG